MTVSSPLHTHTHTHTHTQDSYLMSYFSSLNTYLHTGAPVYFVVKDGFDYTTQDNQNKVGVVICIIVVLRLNV